jgi:transcription-repair coupling factor (superfamily II helicase)
VGFDLYAELLAEAVEKCRGQGVRHDIEPEIKLPVVAVLPEEYVPEPMHRLDYYQRMTQAQSDAEIFDVCGEIEDRYGRAPEEVRHLAELMVIRRRLRTLGASALSAAREEDVVRIGVNFVLDAPVDRDDLVRRCQHEPGRYRLLPSGRLAITAAADGPGDLGLLKCVRHEVGRLKRTTE